MADVKSILLVEDNDDNRFIYTTFLRRRGFRVFEAHSGWEGIEVARAELPDLILMDISLPIMDGLEATRRLKSDEATSSIPVIALTAHAMPGDRAKAQRAGCEGYLSKPVAPTRVAEEVERRIGAPGDGDPGSSGSSGGAGYSGSGAEHGGFGGGGRWIR